VEEADGEELLSDCVGFGESEADGADLSVLVSDGGLIGSVGGGCSP